MTNITSSNSTTVRFSVPPSWLVAPLKAAPWLQKPVLTRLFLRPTKRARAASDRIGQVVGTVRVGGARVKVRARGSGPSVLLVHGWQGSSSHLSVLGDRLVAAGYTVVACDMPAHGETAGSLTSLPEFSDTIAAVNDLVGPFHGVVAHSLGATAVSLALKRGALSARSVVFVAPMPSFDFALDEFAKILHLDEQLREATASGTEARVGITRPEVDLFSFAPPARHLAIAHDVDDERVPYRFSQALRDRWQLPEALTSSGLGHKRILQDERLAQWVIERMKIIRADSPLPLAFQFAPELTF